ncbi:MAG: PAS domain-containing sensor histidine kinase [Candidatus Electrothrix sp. GM3_4]|nr:PAS domain-containing sensor histidine kinase [Candidatus Electrothrix sp. GM3_4]
MGYYYTQKFYEEIDQNLKNKISMSAALLSRRDLNVNTVINKDSFEKLLQERIHEVFIAKPSGLIYYSSPSVREGVHYERYLDEDEKKQFQKINQHFSEQQVVFHQHNNRNFISTLSPLGNIGNKTNIIGVIYIKIDGDAIAARKKEVVRVFLVGSLITVLLTSLLEVLLLHYLFVPRINKTRAVLSLVEQGNLSVRIPGADSLDQLGSLMRHVNRIIAVTERNTRLLKMLNEAGASFVTADSLDKLSELINKEVTNLQIYVSQTAHLDTGYQEKKNHSLDPNLVLDRDLGFQLSSLPSIDTSYKKRRREGDEEKYLFPLLSMANSAFFRLRLWQKNRGSEKKYRTLFSSAVEGIFSYTIDGILEIANPSLAKMMGYETPQSMIDLFHQERRRLFGSEKEQEKIFTQIHEQGQVQDVEIRPRRADGFRFWASLTAHLKRDQKGKPISINGRIANIEERKRREKIEYDYLIAQAANQAKSEMMGEFKSKNRELEKALAQLHDTQLRMIQAERMAAIGMTASGVAHDLNNILAGVINYAELILYQLPDSTKMRISAQCILDSGKRAADVVAELLTLTRGTAQNRVPILLNSIITKYLESAEFQYLSEQYPHIYISTSLAQNLFPVLGIPVYKGVERNTK